MIVIMGTPTLITDKQVILCYNKDFEQKWSKTGSLLALAINIGSM